MKQEQMNAVIFESPGVVTYKKMDRPLCGSAEVIVRIHRIGICGTDVEMYHGHINKVRFPIVPGHEWSGEIVEVGAAVKGFAIGDRVVGETTISCGHCDKCKNGAYNMCVNLAETGIFGKNGAACEYMSFPTFGLHKFNAGISYDQACLIEPSAIAFRGLEKMRITPRDVLAVIGPGPIGLLTIAIAKHFGVRKVVLIGFHKSRLELGKRFGADDVIDLSKDDYLERALEVTNGELFTAITEASGSAEACEQLFSISASGCKVCLLGSYGENLPRIDATKIVDNDMEIHGSLSSPGVWNTVVNWMESTSLNVTELITHHLDLQSYSDALKLIEQKDPKVIKVLIQPGLDSRN